jgi:hypothetical protein
LQLLFGQFSQFSVFVRKSGHAARPARGSRARVDRVILFCVATGIDHGSVHITDHPMQSMAIRDFIAHNRESGAYTLTDSGRAALTAILEGAP